MLSTSGRAQHLLVIALGTVLLSGVAASVYLNGQVRPEHDGEAVVACRQAVEDRLSLPKSGDGFGVPVTRVTVSALPARYVVAGRTSQVGKYEYVDFTCTVKYQPGPDAPVRVVEVVTI